MGILDLFKNSSSCRQYFENADLKSAPSNIRTGSAENYPAKPEVSVRMLNRGLLEIVISGKTALFDGELGSDAFLAETESMRWIYPEQRAITAEEFEKLKPVLKAAYRALPKGERVPVDFFSNNKRCFKLC